MTTVDTERAARAERGAVRRALPRDGEDPRRAEDRGRQPGHAKVAGHRAGRGGAWQKIAPDSEAVFQTRRKQAGPDKATTRNAAALRALWIAAQRFKRTVLRALDYLPPGEVTFADYGRAIIASDQASHPDSGRQRDWLKAEFVSAASWDRRRRCRSQTNYRHPAVARLDLEELVRSDWLAYEFANTRAACWPSRSRSRSRWSRAWTSPRPTTTARATCRSVRECLFKVSWTETEPNAAGRPAAPAAAAPGHDAGHRLGDPQRSRGGHHGQAHGGRARRRATLPRRDARAPGRARRAADRSARLRARRSSCCAARCRRTWSTTRWRCGAWRGACT